MGQQYLKKVFFMPTTNGFGFIRFCIVYCLYLAKSAVKNLVEIYRLLSKLDFQIKSKLISYMLPNMWWFLNDHFWWFFTDLALFRR